MTSSAALLTVLLPAAAAVAGLGLARSRVVAAEWAVGGALALLAAAVVEAWGVATSGPVAHIAFLGDVDLGTDTLSISLDLRSDSLSSCVAVAVALVAACVQVYSTAYLSGERSETGPMRYRAYAATVSLFTASMMLVVHADDLVVLLVGWEGMGICSYLLVGHHSERASARAAAVKAFLVTRVGDLGVMTAIVVLLIGAHTTSIHRLTAEAASLPSSTVTAAALLLLTGVAGKSAQFPLHTWLPDAMEGPTPVSALIHAATMVAAGVYLVARLAPVFLAADGAMAVAAVIASITMLGAAFAAIAQDDLKRLLAWSTVSQVAYMLAGVALAQTPEEVGVGVFHLLSHAGFKALLFLVAGCVTHVVGSTRLVDMGGLRRTHPSLSVLLALGLAALAGVPPLGGFWSKEAVLTTAEDLALAPGSGWVPKVVLAAGLITTLLTGVYAGRAYAVVALGPSPGAATSTAGDAAHAGHDVPAGSAAHGVHDAHGAHHELPRAMTWPLWVLSVPTVGIGLILLAPPEVLHGVHVEAFTGFTGTLLSLAGAGWALSATRLGGRDVADALPPRARAFLCAGYRLDDVQDRLVVRPVTALARFAAVGDRDVVDAVPRGGVVLAEWAGRGLRLTQTGLATGYVAWVAAGAVIIGLAGVILA